MSGEESGTALVEQRSPADIESPVTHGEIDTLWRLAAALSKSGFFRDAKRESEAFAKLVFGRDLGLSATQAMSEIHIIEGKPEMSANLQASKVKASGQYDYRVLDLTDSKCAIEFGPAPAPMRDTDGQWLPWPGALGISEFTTEDAKRADLSGKANHRRYPRNMLFARAMSNGVAWYCPDVMNGIRVYAEGEIAEARTARPEPAQNAEQPSEEPVDATIVEDAEQSGLLDDEARMELAQAIEASGVKLDLILSAVGISSLDEACEEHKLLISQEIAKAMARNGGEQ